MNEDVRREKGEAVKKTRENKSLLQFLLLTSPISLLTIFPSPFFNFFSKKEKS